MAEEYKNDVPYIVFESAMAREERHTRRIIYVLIASIVLVALSNMAWLWAWMQYDYVSEETVIQQDGEGININGNNNGVTNGAENYEAETDAY